MVTKGILQTIDFNGNTCTVRLPYFETASINDPIVLNATLMMVPGVYNGYKPNDVVLVAFEDGQINNPVVIGKLFLGTNNESAEPRGAIDVANLKVGQEATIPVDTKLTYAGDDKNRAAVAKDLSTYKTVADIIKSIQNHSEKIGSATAQLIDDGIKLGAKVDKVNDGSETGFGWELTDSGWAIFARNSDWALRDRMNLMTVDSEGTTFLGKVKILNYPIDTETRYIQLWANTQATQPTDDTWNEWSATMPSRADGKYIWSCVKTVKYIKDPVNPNTLTEQTTYSDPVCLSGVDGKDGEKGDTGIGVKKVIDLFKIVKSSITNVADVPTPDNKEYSEDIKWTNSWLASPDGWKIAKDQAWWTCIATVYTDNSIKYSTPIKNNAYALAQGKNTTYYSDQQPVSAQEGDCWFDTSVKPHGTLKQFAQNEKTKELEWVDIGGELVANKVTANYINAQGITATSIKVLDDYHNTLFEAGGTPDTDENGNIILDEKGQPTIKDGVVTLAGWKANATSIRSTETNDNVVLRSRNTELEAEGQALKAKYVEFDAEHPQAFAIDLSQTNAKVDKIDLAKLKIEIQGENISSGVLLSIPRATTSTDPNYSSTSDSTLDFRLTADTSSSIQVQYNYANEPLPPGIFHPIYPPIITPPPTDPPPGPGGGGGGVTPLPTKALLKSNDSAGQNGSAEAQSGSSDETTYPKVQINLSVDNPLRLTGEQTSDGFRLTGAKSDYCVISTDNYRGRYSHSSILYIGSVNGGDADGGKLVGKITSYKIWYDSNLLIDLQPRCKVKTIDGKASYQGYLHDAQNNTDYLLGSAGEIKTEPETEFVSIATGVKLNDIKNLTEENLTEALKTAKFAVTNEGKLYANEATINGAVTAGSGKIGNLDVSKSGLYLANAGGRSSFGLENTDCQYIKYATNASTANIHNTSKTSIVAKITVTRDISLLSLFLGCSGAKTGSFLPIPTITRNKSYCMVTIPTSKKADFKLPYGTQNAFVINSTDTNKSGYQEDINNCSQATLRNLTAGNEFYIIFAFRKATIGGPIIDSEPWPPNGWFFVPKSLVDDGSIIINTRIAETLAEGDSTKPTYNEKNHNEYQGSPLANSGSLYLYTKEDSSNNLSPAYFSLYNGNASKLPIASLKLGANFSANSIGDFSAEYGKIGPWTIAGDKFKYSYFGKATDVFGDKIEQWYNQEATAYWDGAGLAFTGVKVLDEGSSINYGGESYKKFTTTTRINAREGVCATNLYRLLYNNSVAQRANAASSASTADDNWRKCSLISSISNTTLIDKVKKRGVSINAIATFKVRGKTLAGYVTVDSGDSGGLANIKPVAGLRISHADGVSSFDTNVRIWMHKDDDGNHYTSYCDVYAEANKEIDVIIFGTAMHERKANGQ